MRAEIALNSTTTFELRDAFLVYSGGRSFASNSPETFITQHPVKLNAQGVPTLGAGTPVTKDAVIAMGKDLCSSIPVEFLPENVLCRTAEAITWWTPATLHPMFYSTGQSAELMQISGKRLPQPPLLLRLDGGSLHIRALKKNERPKATTGLYRAPYWNVSDNGSVCLGDTRVPVETTVATLPEWEKAFFQSEFTHSNASLKLTTHPGGFAGLWKSLIGKKVFPTEHLADAKQTLLQFIS